MPRDTALAWHLDVYQARSTAEAASLARSLIVESQGTIWLFTIAPPTWRAPNGRHIATIGPLPLGPAPAFAAVYLQEHLLPGSFTPAHRHPGTEVRFPLDGEACIETPTGILRQTPGGSAPILKPGVPLQARGVGTTLSKTLVLLLEDADQRRALPAPDWKPTGACAS